ncbi:MAG: DNA polymerase III subunit gamma/tau [Lachnospiraceae bacterium]|nr:DNA polymerase III subunit gamma/tau [Lachnospiraceae bacterium]
MSYVALYRKFRPGEFEEVKGQEHIVTTLTNQIKADRIGHAYLFCGTRGTGKTTIAKLFARAVNCENPKDGSPCNECPTCRAILEGRSMNVVEIDAASNNGVDNIREIRDEVNYSPTEGKYRVYIIDEVHMLSAGAYNALLKTLEEPPSYVIFILATTEVHKIPVTVLSRCQRYDFRRISIETITGRLREISDREGLDVEEKALSYIARVADGSMRDALSLLDRCIAFFMGEGLTYDKVLDTLGAVDTGVYGEMFEMVLKKDVAGLMSKVEEIVLAGRELTNFVNEFTWYLRNLMLLKSSDEMEDVIDVSSENLAVLKEQASKVDFDDIVRYIRIFSQLSNDIKDARQKRVVLEVALIKLCKPQMEQDNTSLVKRISELEKKLESGDFKIPEGGRSGRTPSGSEDVKPEEKEKERIPIAALPEDLQQIAASWKSICSGLEQPLVRYVSNAEISAGGDSLIIVPDNNVALTFLNSGDSLDTVKKLIADRTGKSVNIQVSASEKSSFRGSFIDLSNVEGINMPIDIED